MSAFKKPSGLIIYDGPSLLDGKPIVCIATGIFQSKTSNNVKTGDMIQTWIIRKDIHPHEAVQKGEDKSICGDCKHRRGTGGACYVIPAQAPSQIYKAYLKGNYIPLDNDNIVLFKNRLLRLGAYGDPSAVPYEIWEKLLKRTVGHTGYSHQWKNPKIDKRLQEICMASVDNPFEFEEANKAGWRTFRVKSINDSLLKGEFVCPASEEQGKRLTCQTCLACCGGHPPKGSVVINVHGVIKKRFEQYANLTIKGITTTI
jgi:hypothetical protein